LEKLSQGLRRLKLLRKLSIWVMECERIREEGFGSLGMAISKLKSLESLEILYASDRYSGNLGLKKLSQSLGSLENLKNVSLLFEGCRYLTDVDLVYVKEGLKKLKLVRNITLRFDRCNCLTSLGFKEICDGLAGYGLLKFLRLEFSLLMTDEGLKALGLVLSNMNELESLILDLRVCQFITSAGLDELKKGIVNLPKIKMVTLNFLDCKKLNGKIMKIFEQELKENTNIKDLVVPNLK